MTADQFHGLQAGEEFNPLDNPDLANQFGNMAMGVGTQEPILIAGPPDGTVTLPGGLLTPEGVRRDAVVRELNGEDEEELARPAVRRDLMKYVDTLLNRCVVSIGDEPASRRILDELLIGDRDMLIQAIRVVTYGDTMRLDITCPGVGCGHKYKVDYSFSNDVPIKKLDDIVVEIAGTKIPLEASRHTYQVPLRNGVAQVNLITGYTQRTVYTLDNEGLSLAELNTRVLSQCVQTVNGTGVGVRELLHMSAADRKRLTDFLGQAQFGPQWTEVSDKCPRCEREFPLIIDTELMFRGE